MLSLLSSLKEETGESKIDELVKRLKMVQNPFRKDVLSAARKALYNTTNTSGTARDAIKEWIKQSEEDNKERFNSHLISESEKSPLNIKEVKPTFSEDAKSVDGRVVIRDNFDKIFELYPNTLVFGEDAGKLGDVNKGLEGMQDKYGEIRVTDTGIREATILGQGIGMSIRGLRPIADIQYLDYVDVLLSGTDDELISQDTN